MTVEKLLKDSEPQILTLQTEEANRIPSPGCKATGSNILHVNYTVSSVTSAPSG